MENSYYSLAVYNSKTNQFVHCLEKSCQGVENKGEEEQIATLLKRYQIGALIDGIAIFKKKIAGSCESNDEKLRRAMQKLRDNCDTVLSSELVKIIIRNEGIKASIKTIWLSGQESFSSSTTLPLPIQFSIASKRDSDEFNDNTNNVNSKKKLNYLKLGDIKGLSSNDKLDKLTKAYGEGNILDLAFPGLIPSRFAKEMKDIVCELKSP
ncbi:MAG: hypothetical protein EXX96DRAFT_616403 [Benjaminiella poitrasii]|nr:MAG: hypothetical protein EXX96DRAFT_616403 [Benjaminiella poitrasii]